jgi:uncharacterized protein (TIGR02266 family)
MYQERSRRRSLRAPVYLDVRCDLRDRLALRGKATNLSPAGIFVETTEPIRVGEHLAVEFILPGTLNSVQFKGEAVWTRSYDEGQRRDQSAPGTGVRFIGVEDTHRDLLRDYTLKMLDDEAVAGGERILQVLDEIRNLTPSDRLKAYRILIKKGPGSML